MSERNSLHRRNHKERGQLAHRKRLGILEKHKDYVQRAQDFNAKKQKVKRLKQKVADRNKDEFYFGMVNKRTKGGVHYQDRGNVALPIDLVNVLKAQDEGYLRTTRTANLKRIDKLKEELGLLLRGDLSGEVDDNGLDEEWDEEDLNALRTIGMLPQNSGKRKKKGKHIVFVDDEVAVKSYSPPRAQKLSPPEKDENMMVDLGWIPITSTSSKQAIKEDDTETLTSGSHSEVIKRRKDLLSELLARFTRDQHLRYALRELEMQRALMGKGASRKIKGPELIKDPNAPEDELDEDEQDALFGKRRKQPKKQAPEMVEYKPRVYKFRAERKR